MNAFQRKITLRVYGGHILFFAVYFMLIPSIRGCFRPRPKEIVTFVEFGPPAPRITAEEIERMVATASDPAPPEPAPPEPAPPEPDTIPEPEKKRPEPQPHKKKEEVKPQPRPEPVKPEKTTWKAKSADEIKLGKRIDAEPTAPALSANEIRQALSGVTKTGSPTGSPDAINRYLAQVRSFFYARWTPPATASSVSGSTVVRIMIRKNGQIRTRANVSSSGDPLFDRTVMEAVNSVSMLPAPPSDYPYDYVEVVFSPEH